MSSVFNTIASASITAVTTPRTSVLRDVKLNADSESFSRILNILDPDWEKVLKLGEDCDGIDFCSTLDDTQSRLDIVTNEDNFLKNLDALYKKSSRFFELPVVIYFLHEYSNVDEMQYLAQCGGIDNQRVIDKIISLTPKKILREILATKSCTNVVFRSIKKALKSRLDLNEDTVTFTNDLDMIALNWKKMVGVHENGFGILHNFSYVNEENYLKNLDILYKKDPEFFSLLVVKYYPFDNGLDYYYHYFAECKDITSQRIIDKIISITPKKTLLEILKTKVCTNIVFESIERAIHQ